ncbi:hypothetical protein A3Q56_07271 [Intoshia linei]|uniref:Uncharacterized protein n=1 Tax=Intoshia linei TaxID=1819745 RepID=A0A177AS68_9BILA|nr:hypothetical protein A3Q56_07271 [Intoshia linei]
MKFVSACIKFTWSLNDTISFGVSHVTGINELTFVNESIALYDLIEGYTNQIDKNIDIFVRYFTKMLVNHVSNSLFGKMKIFLDNSESFLYENFLLQIEGVQQKMQSYSQDSSTFYNAEYFLIANKNISEKIKKDCDGTILQSFRMFTKLCIDKNGICLSEYDSCQNVVLNLKNH